ncbi:MAG: cytosine permease, partial [Microbacterium sp.]|nr:cytosine permease [Microbacterium sp.]
GLTLSRAVFGPRGNFGPTIVSWLGFVGWETVMCATATFALLQIVTLLGIDPNPLAVTTCVLLIVAVAATIGLFGHATILFLQKWLTWVFGGITAVVIAFLLPNVQWDLVAAQPPAPTAALIGGIGFVAAGTGLGWLSAGADYARYLPRHTDGKRIVWATALGALIPITVLVALGALLGVGDDSLASTLDPVAAIGAALPSWLLVPYLLTAVAGLIAGADLSMYSSGLNFVSAGVPVRRTTAVAIDAALIVLGALYITVIAQDFFGPFTAFLTLLAIPLTTWAVVFAIDMIHRTEYDGEALMDTTASGDYWYTSGVRWPAVIAWAVGIIVGVSLTTVTVGGEILFRGFLAGTWFGQNGLAWLGGGIGAAIVFGTYTLLARRATVSRRAGEIEDSPMAPHSDSVSNGGVTAAPDPRDRARGAMLGLAVGDALGMPTQYLSRELIRRRYGQIYAFLPGPADNDFSRGLPAGRVTDDTDQAVILGNLLVEGNGNVDVLEFSRQLIAWEARMRASGSLDLLGPSTLKALTLVSAGTSPDETGRWGDTNGAAMRIAPVGIVTTARPLSLLVDATEQASRVTHNTGIAIAGAAAIAAAISSGISGSPFSASLEAAVAAARIGQTRGHYVAGADVADRIAWAVDLVRERPVTEALDLIYRLVGVGIATQEAVPAAFAVASMFSTNAWDACRHAASLGGDCDTIAAMAGAVVGAHVGGSSIPQTIQNELATANPTLELTELADHLYAVRNNRLRS